MTSEDLDTLEKEHIKITLLKTGLLKKSDSTSIIVSTRVSPTVTPRRPGVGLVAANLVQNHLFLGQDVVSQFGNAFNL